MEKTIPLWDLNLVWDVGQLNIRITLKNKI